MPTPLQSKYAELTEEQKIMLYNNIFGSLEGQLILEDLKLRAFFYESTNDPRFCSSDRDLFMNEGTRKLLLYILDMSRPLTENELQPKED